MPPPRIVFIWHAGMMPSYRKLLEELYAVSDAELHLIVPPRWPEAGLELRAEAGPQKGYWIHVLTTWFIGRHYSYFMPRLARTLKQLRPDVIYCYAGAYWLNTVWTMWLVRRLLPATLLIFVSDQTLQKTYPPPFSWFESWVMRRADFATSCDAEGVLRLVDKGFPRDRAATVPLGFDASLFHPAPAAVARAVQMSVGAGPVHSSSYAAVMEREPIAPLRILYAGRLIAMKGVQDLLDACALLNEPYTLTFVGDGEERQALEKRAAERGVRADFLGARQPAEVAGLMRSSDVLVLPSRTMPGKWKEQFGRVLVEAMASGCVPVGSDSGAIPSVVGDGGLIYPEGDVAALAQRLTAIAADRDLLQQLRTSALERANQRYSWRAVAGVLWNTLQHVRTLPRRSAVT